MHTDLAFSTATDVLPRLWVYPNLNEKLDLLHISYGEKNIFNDVIITIKQEQIKSSDIPYIL